MHHGEVQITAQQAWGRAGLSAGTKHCDQRGTGTHPQTPPVLSSQTSGGPQGPRLERLFTVSGSGVQERPTPTLRPMEPGADASARRASEQPQGSEGPGPQRLPRTRLPSKQVCSQKPKPSTRHPAGSPGGVCGEGAGAEGTPGPSQPCSRGGVNTRGAVRALSPGHICLCHVSRGSSRDPRPGSDGGKQDGHVSGPSQPLGPFCSHPPPILR